MTVQAMRDALEVHLLTLYNLGRHNYRYTDNNDHDKAAQIQHDAEVMIEYIIGEVFDNE